MDFNKLLGIEIIDEDAPKGTCNVSEKEPSAICIIGFIVGLLILIYGLVIPIAGTVILVSVDFKGMVAVTWGIMICTCSILGGFIVRLYIKIDELTKRLTLKQEQNIPQDTACENKE